MYSVLFSCLTDKRPPGRSTSVTSFAESREV